MPDARNTTREQVSVVHDPLVPPAIILSILKDPSIIVGIIRPNILRDHVLNMVESRDMIIRVGKVDRLIDSSWYTVKVLNDRNFRPSRAPAIWPGRSLTAGTGTRNIRVGSHD